MNALVTRPAPWSNGRMWSYFVVVMAVQIILLLTLSERKPLSRRQPEPAIVLYAVTEVPYDSPVAALLALGDPTLFALPHPHGFSGPAWLNAAPLQYQAADWTEPQRWLAQSGAQLGESFQEFVHTNVVTRRSLVTRPLTLPEKATVSPLRIRARSTYRIEGDLDSRDLMTPLKVPSLSHTDLLTNTVVRVAVYPSGFVFSPVLLEGSGSKDADQLAYDLARSVRFKPLAGAATASVQSPVPLTWGKIVFQWHALEMPATNSPAAQPSP